MAMAREKNSMVEPPLGRSQITCPFVMGYR